ncbi:MULTISPECIES: DUF2007 domain-containing protein [Parabacteroides]|uniref:putative signal transducing protein n=1 Tax=Parabacteroides leei TaxID=2939491 RepID=UPI00189952D9|nr:MULTISPECIES: DUF2007 domain-containing protein [Parabacteroides]MCL3852345.1 DUF2007 domain-containing protein [Parabacteroides leei]
MKTVFLSTLENSFQAGLLKDLLINEGIESFFKNENISNVLGNISGFQLEIYVFEKDYERAKEILKEALPQLVGE